MSSSVLSAWSKLAPGETIEQVLSRQSVTIVVRTEFSDGAQYSAGVAQAPRSSFERKGSLTCLALHNRGQSAVLYCKAARMLVSPRCIGNGVCRMTLMPEAAEPSKVCGLNDVLKEFVGPVVVQLQNGPTLRCTMTGLGELMSNWMIFLEYAPGDERLISWDTVAFLAAAEVANPS